ncbi:HD domain-containing protein [Pseudorhodoferax sp.]|jgi:phosphonate degradation associated HDIG domain protein|uniref:HD domain-containing protein n=1 Tax=Pseudorhodoferax sp. TaxID=1993553 RepID=UPI001B7B7F01|nr:phosphohydrolase [Pseudorhodoferax sp.]MBP8145583.1 phosphohydrolase [Inhella sp.]
MPYDLLNDLRAIYLDRARQPYGRTAVQQLQHALQSAWAAERAGASPELISAALLHDIGHMIHDLGEHPVSRGVDDHHEERGAAWLAWHFGPEVTEPVRLHVAAKRYLCATQVDPFGQLSRDALDSLTVQGGPMNEAECAAFEREPHAQAALQLRLWDEAAKDPAADPPDWAHFEPFVEQARARTATAESVY